jgi:hypothetical protein
MYRSLGAAALLTIAIAAPVRLIAVPFLPETRGNDPISCGKSSPGGSSKLPAGASAILTSYARALQALGFGKRQNRVNGRFPFSPRLRVS